MARDAASVQIEHDVLWATMVDNTRNSIKLLGRHADGHVVAPLLNVGHDVPRLARPVLFSLLGQPRWQLDGFGRPVTAATADFKNETLRA